jgi:hypothetical protein
MPETVMPDDSVPAVGATSHESRPKRPGSFTQILIALLIAIAGGCLAIYYWQHGRIAALTAPTASLSAQIAAEQKLVTIIQNQNLGIVPSPATQGPPNQIRLVDGKVLLTIPSGWMKATVSDFDATCGGPTIDSTDLCVDIATIVPAALNVHQTAGAVHFWGASVLVYQFADNAAAEKWFQNIEAADSSNPYLINVSKQPVNGYSADCSTNRNLNDDGSVYYETTGCAIVHGIYGVTVGAQVLNHESPDGSPRTNDFTQYIAGINEFAKSIRFQD